MIQEYDLKKTLDKNMIPTKPISFHNQLQNLKQKQKNEVTEYTKGKKQKSKPNQNKKPQP